MTEAIEGMEIKSMARLLYKYNHLCDVWDAKRISVKDFCSRMTELEWKINSLMHKVQSEGVPVEVIFYRNLDSKRIQYFYDGRDITSETLAGLFV